jgi:hypothetical protein
VCLQPSRTQTPHTHTHTLTVGDVSPQETSITIENLKPDHHYVIRIVTLNAANFQAPSAPVRVRTLPVSSDQSFNNAPKDSQYGGDDEDYNPTPIIRPNKNLVDVIIPPIAAPIMTREHSNSTSRVRRSEPGRRNSPASQTLEQARSAQEAVESMDSIKQLTEKLDALRREIDDVEKQVRDEEEEFRSTKASLMEKRDEKKTALKEKEDASRDLRKEVATLERANATAQARRTQHERTLRQKEAERKKLKDDVARWAHDAGQLRSAAEAIEKERAEYESESEKRIQELREKYAAEIQTNKSLEKVIQETGIQIKALEEERKMLEEGEERTENQEGVENADAEEDRRYMVTMNALQQSYAHAWTVMNQAERANQEASARLHYLQQRRLSQPQLFASIPSQEPIARRRTSQRSRPVSMREASSSVAPGGFVHTTTAPFNSSVTNLSPSFPTATPYFNINNGMALPPPSARNMSSFSAADIESLTAGAPMSPTAGSLLPAGLFGDESGLTDAEDEDNDPGPPQPLSLDPSPNMHHVLPGLGAPGTLEQTQDPSSPVSVQSRSPSVFASPRESAGQLANFSNTDYAVDSDKRSIRSTSSSFLNNPSTTRFGSLFNLHRQRGKTFSDQGPTLGSLKASQSQSLPRQDAGLDAVDTQGRRGSHSEGAWYNTLLRTSKTQPVELAPSPQHVSTRKRQFNMFGSKGDPWLTSVLGAERPSSPRQGSTQSGESSLLPRPSTESQTRFGWSVDAFGARSSPLGVDWSMNNMTSWSRMPSRRPSLQHGSTTSLVHEDLLQDDLPDFPSTTMSPTQAPIGTRPDSSASHMPTPLKALNPAAPNFTSIFLRQKRSEEEKADDRAKKAAEKEAKKAEKKEDKAKARAEKSDKAARKEKDKLLPSDTGANDSGRDMYSPTGPRRSRDTRSISTADVSEASPRESFDWSLSHTPSDSQTNLLGKETFMQKLSRKGSTSHLLPFALGKSSLFSKKSSEIATPDEMDEDSVAVMSRSVESAGNSPSIGTPKDKTSFGWTSLKRMGKRGDKTPSLHESIASEATGDEDEDDMGSAKGTA